VIAVRAALVFVVLFLPGLAFGQEEMMLGEAFESAIAGAQPEHASDAVRLVLILTAMSMLPGLVMVMTPFTRFVIVFSLLRQALGLQQSPPNQVLIGLSLVLTLLVMHPTINDVNHDAMQPYMAGEISTEEAYDAAIGPMRVFMLRNVKRSDLATSMRIARMSRPDTIDDVPTAVVMTAFLLSELHTAFTIAVKVYIPFLVMDIVVASVLLGMGMMMLPPVVISLPFKLAVFVLMDGWGLLVTGLVASIQ